MAFTSTWSTIAATQTDADSPLDTVLIDGIRQNLIYLREYIGSTYTPSTAHNHDGVNSALVSESIAARTGVVMVWDDFLHDSIIGWTNHGNGSTAANAVSGRQRFTGDGTNARYGLSQLITKPFQLSGGNTITFETKVITSAVVAPYYYFGLMDADDLTGNGIIMGAAGAAAIVAKTARSSTVTTTDTPLTWSSNSTYILKFEASSASIGFYVDGTLKATHTTNIPLTGLGLTLFIRGAVTTVDVDYVFCKSSSRI